MSDNREPVQKNKPNTFRILVWAAIALVVLNLALTAVFVLRWRNIGNRTTEEKDAAVYDRHFAMIVRNDNSEFWNSVYRGAQERGSEQSAWVERMGVDLTENYSKSELMKIAIAEKVDGIMLECSEDEDMTELINEATEQGIPVVTMVRDESGSDRISFVGISYYNLGQQYAEQILKLVGERKTKSKVFLLMNSNIADSSRTIIYSTIQDILSSNAQYEEQMSLSPVMINESNSFEAEENIRDIFMDKDNLPDVIVCLDEVTSVSVYQALIDYNRVGRVDEIAYYGGSAVLNGIRKNVIRAAASVDTASIGSNAVEALLEYEASGYASDYYSVDTFNIDRSNVEQYMEDGADE